MRLLRALLVVACTVSVSGCYVVTLRGLADTASAEFDESLLGRWDSVEDEIHVLLERDEWHTYAVTWRDRSGEQRFTGRLVTLGGRQFFDVTLHGGTELGPAALPVHVPVRLTRQDTAIVVETLAYDWFRGRVDRGSLVGLTAVLDERETVIVTASDAAWRKWLAGHAGSPMVFEEAMVLTRSPGETK